VSQGEESKAPVNFKSWGQQRSVHRRWGLCSLLTARKNSWIPKGVHALFFKTASDKMKMASITGHNDRWQEAWNESIESKMDRSILNKLEAVCNSPAHCPLVGMSPHIYVGMQCKLHIWPLEVEISVTYIYCPPNMHRALSK